MNNAMNIVPVPERYLAVPPSGKGPGVLVLHAWWGLTDFIRGFCDRLALAGFVAIAPDLFSGRLARTVAEAESLRTQIDEERDAPPVILSALEALRQHPAVTPGGLGTIGFSLGGYWALWLAAQHPEAIRAATIFYATDGDSLDFQPSKAAFLGHFAEMDPYEPAPGVASLEQRLKAANRPARFYTYPGAGHWFFESDRADAYDAPAAQLAWERTVDFLHANLDAPAGG